MSKHFKQVPALLDGMIQRTDTLVNNITKINFLSLDVEGYEISVLNGLDLNVYRPTYCLLETSFNFANGRRLVAVSDHMIRNGYEALENFGASDTLYRSLI